MQMKQIAKTLFSAVRQWPTVFHGIRVIIRPGPAIYRHLHFIGKFRVMVSAVAGFEINHYGYQVENELFWAGFGHGYEGMSLRVWRALAEEAAFVADVGANTGVYALSAAAVNPKARVIALEPVPRVYEKLISNFALNPFHIEAIQVAASDIDGEAILFDTVGEHTYSASLDSTMVKPSDSIKIRVRCARIDTLLDEIKCPQLNLIKIDVEKHEPAVLAGMAKRLAHDRPTLLIEILNGEIGEAVAQSVFGLGYRIFGIDEENGLMEVATIDSREAGRNFLLCHEDVWARVGAKVSASIE